MARIGFQTKLSFSNLENSSDGIEMDSQSYPQTHYDDAHHDDHEHDHTEPTESNGPRHVAGNDLYKLHGLFKPVTFVMGCFGVYHPSPHVVSGKAVHHDFRATDLLRYVTIFLALCNFGFLISNLVAFVVARPRVDMGILTANIYVILLVWLAFGGLLTLLHFIIFEGGKVDRMWHMWAKWAERYPYDRNWSGMRLIRNVCLAVACFCTVVPTVVVAVGSARATPGTWIEEVLLPIEYGGPMVNHIWLTIDFTVIVFVVYGTASFTTVFFVLNCLVVTTELQNLHYVIEEHLTNGKMWNDIKDISGRMSQMEELRRRRLLARKIVQEMDSTFKIVAFLSLFANVPLIVFIVYALVLHGPKSEFLLVIGVIVTLLALAQVGFVVVAAAWINKWADAPRGLLHAMIVRDTSKMSRLNNASILLFLNELAGESIGITAWGIALITKQFIATVVGLAVTYIIVLLQFNAAFSMLTLTTQISHTLSNITTDLNETQHLVSGSVVEAAKDAYY